QIEALRSLVLIATPTTLVALLRTLAMYHQQESLAVNARQIADAARELYERGTKFGGDLVKVGKGLHNAITAYNAAVGSFDTRFVPMARRLEDLDVPDGTKPALEGPTPIDEIPRPLRGAASDAAAA